MWLLLDSGFWSPTDVQKSNNKNVARCHTEVNMEATAVSVYIFIDESMCIGSQQIRQQAAADNNKDDEKETDF